MTGEQISHYEVQEKLGSGGMGDVWKARDSVLKRTVALKVLRAGDASDSKRRARMLEEARAAGALNHTNIAALYDVLQEGTRDILVMEYVPGPRLDEFIGGKPLKNRTVIELATQLANGLAAAHRIGLTHRDLKPSNLIVTNQNTIKILDFGLAKRVDLAVAPVDPGATLTVALTENGQVVGTPAYMSPEQAEGQPVDSRSDIFSFGIVLYEMLAGKAPFSRDSRTATLNAIVHEDPAPIEGLSRPLQRLLSACLEKDVSRRMQSMADIRLFLEAASETTTSTSASGIAPALARSRKFPVGLSAGVLIGAAAAWFLIPRAPSTTSFTPVRITIDGQSHDPAISPDGKLVAYSSERAAPGNRDIWVQDVDTGSAIRLTTEPTAENNPIFSADGSQIYFSSNRKPAGIYSMSRLGGEARLIVAQVNLFEPSPDGKWLAYIVRGGKLYVRPAAGGEAKLVYEEESLNGAIRWYTDSRHLILNASNVGSRLRPAGRLYSSTSKRARRRRPLCAKPLHAGGSRVTATPSGSWTTIRF